MRLLHSLSAIGFIRQTNGGMLALSAPVEGISASMPNYADNSEPDETVTRIKDQTVPQFWVSVLVGTMVAGGVFGFVFGFVLGAGYGDPVPGVFGLIFGVIFAGAFGSPVIVTVATATWWFRLFHFRVVMGGLAGGLTGIIATSLVHVSLQFPFGSLRAGVVLAGLLGALGGELGGRRQHSRKKAQDGYDQVVREHRIQFTLGDLFVRVAVISTLLAAYVLAVNSIEMKRENARRAASEYNLKWIGHQLKTYHDENGSLPPPYVADDNGRPLFSWRVLVVDQLPHYAVKERMDISQAWDSPTNRPVVDSFHNAWPDPSEVKRPWIAHYVAVVGPGTLWEDNGQRQLAEPERRIMAIEWPDSDIHWAEPRDITVDELLSWLSNADHRDCLFYVDGSGEVGELRTETDPETIRRLCTGEGAIPTRNAESDLGPND